MPRRRKVINANVPETDTLETKSNTVVVAYNGVQAQKFEVPTNNGTYKTVIINGNNVDLVGKKQGELYPGGYGLTVVDADAWEWISNNYKNWAPIKNGLMFASTSESVAREAEERKDLRNGFEPLKPDEIRGVERKNGTV